MFSITRTYHFSAAHTIKGHPKCGRLHGHNYKVEVMVSSDELDKRGMIMDFDEIDAVIKPIIDTMDHKYLTPYAAKDPYATLARQVGDACDLPIGTTTAEQLASMLVEMNIGSMPPQVRYMGVSVWETERNMANYGRFRSENG